jgi:hypothetical protein
MDRMIDRLTACKVMCVGPTPTRPRSTTNVARHVFLQVEPAAILRVARCLGPFDRPTPIGGAVGEQDLGVEIGPTTNPSCATSPPKPMAGVPGVRKTTVIMPGLLKHTNP